MHDKYSFNFAGIYGAVSQDIDNTPVFEVIGGISGNRPFINGVKRNFCYLSVTIDFDNRSVNVAGSLDISRIARTVNISRALARVGFIPTMFS